MKKPCFSIVIPTRMRHQTLPYTLRTCLAQSFEDYEIIVADNASLPATRQAVEACQCARIRYLRSDEALPMTANWNRALSAAAGEWILFLGDDDGLFPWSLAVLHDLVMRFPVQAVRWELAVYTWPCVAVADQRNRLQLPWKRQVQLVDAEDRLAQMLQHPHSAPIPLPYHGLIHRSLIERAQQTGPLFDGPCPDTFAGVLLAVLAKRFLETTVPMSLAGVSGQSNGLQGVIEDGSGDTYQDFVRLNAQAGIHFHAALPAFPTMEVIILDGLLRTRDRLQIRDLQWQLSPQTIARHCLHGLWQKGPLRAMLLEELERSLPDPTQRAGLRADPRYAQPRGARPSAVFPLGMHDHHVVLNTEKLSITNVASACQVAGALLSDVSPADDPKSPSVAWGELRHRLDRMGYDVAGLKVPSQHWLGRWTARKLRSIQKRLPWQRAA